MTARGARKSPDRGAAAVEAALVLPLLLLLVFGIIDFGRMLNAQITVTEAAREAARAASLGEPPGARASLVATHLGPVSTDEVESCGKADDAVVDVSYTFTFVTPVAILANFAGSSFTLTSRGVMPCRA